MNRADLEAEGRRHAHGVAIAIKIFVAAAILLIIFGQCQ